MEDLKVLSISKGVRISPRKVSLVAGLVRGRSVADALIILEHTPKRAAQAVSKAIASAKANALNNYRAEESSLMIEHLQVTAASRLKRYRPAAQGRALPFQKRSSHIKVVLNARKKVVKAENKPAKAQPTAEQASEGKKG